MAWPGSASVLIRGQGAAREDIKGGAGRHPATADYRRYVATELDGAQDGSRGFVAGASGCTQAQDAGGDRAGEQDGPGNLGHADKTGRLSSSGSGNRGLIIRLRKAEVG